MFGEFFAQKMTDKGWSYTMSNGRFKASLKRAPRLTDNGKINALPPGQACPVFPVDALPGSPEDWVRGEGSYVCPVDQEWGLWFDWTQNDALNTSVLPSVKGLNPITGLKLEGIKLEKYQEKCPVHNEPFNSGRYCSKCEYKWPAQSYVAHPNTLWLDGFRQPDGTVRQFFFTEEVERDVAAACLGGEKNTVPAFGFAFFEPKVRRNPAPAPTIRFGNLSSGPVFSGFSGYAGAECSGFSGISGTSGISGISGGGPYLGHRKKLQVTYTQPQFYSPLNAPQNWKLNSHQYYPDVKGIVEPAYSLNASPVEINYVNNCSDAFENILRSADSDKQLIHDVKKPDENAKVSVGAGARINQEILEDPMSIEDWRVEPAAIIRLYFVFESKFKKILNDGGIKDLEGHKQGFLKGLKVG